MNIFRKTGPILLFIMLMISCNMLTSKPAEETIPSTNLPVSRHSPEPAHSPIPLLTVLSSSLPPTASPLPPTQVSSIPISMTPTKVVLENGLTWTECAVPDKRYSHEKADVELLSKCADLPGFDENDKKRRGERIYGSNGSDLRLVINDDIFLVKHDSSHGCCDFKFYKNEKEIIKTSAPLITFDPNRNLWNIGGKSVWELISDPPVIFVDGVNYNEKNQWEASYFPYEINGKLIYFARRNGKFHIVYDEKVVGPAFDEISRNYCCGYLSVTYGYGKYWFIGKREGTRFVVLIQ